MYQPQQLFALSYIFRSGGGLVEKSVKGNDNTKTNPIRQKGGQNALPSAAVQSTAPPSTMTLSFNMPLLILILLSAASITNRSISLLQVYSTS